MSAPNLAFRGPRRLTWTVLRVHRTPLWIWTAFLVAGIGGLLWLYRLGELAEGEEEACQASLSRVCQLDVTLYYEGFLRLAATVIAFLPFIVAAYAGGALIGRELENGTAALSWTQSVTPVRWLAAKMAIPALLVTIGTALLTLLFRWVWPSRDGFVHAPWYSSDIFRGTGTVGVAYLLLGLALGTLAGLLMRRALPAMSLALFATLMVNAAGELSRSHLWPAVMRIGEQPVPNLKNAQQVDQGMITASGKRITFEDCFEGQHLRNLEKCVTENDVTHFYAQFHPVSHYWPIQLVETGIVLALAALVTAAAFWLLRRRTP